MSRVVLITGTSSGVGLATAVNFAQKGYRIYASLRQPARSQELRAALERAGSKANIIALDVTDESSVQAAVSEILAKEGRIDVLVNNAGFSQLRGLEQQTMEDIQGIFNVNCFGVIRCIRAVLPAMRKQKSGHIVTVTSVGGLVGQPLSEVYCASKFAMEGLIESLATYLEPIFGIRNTIIEPAGIKTPFVTNAFADLDRELPLKSVYKPVLDRFVTAVTARGSFDANAQSPEEIAALIVEEVARPSGALRIPTSPIARAFAKEKLATDPDGTNLQKKIRAIFLGIS